MRRTAFGRFATLVALAAFARPAGAQASSRPAAEDHAPNLAGVTGLLLAPSAQVVRDRQVQVALSGVAERGFFAGSFALGLGNRAEIGLTALDPDGGAARLRTHAKLNLLPETLLLPALSVGIVDAFDTGQAAHVEGGAGVYVVASKYLVRYFVQGVTGVPLALKIHAGLGGGAFGNAPFAGVEVFPGDGRVSALAELVHGNVNLGARLHAGNFSATVGWLDFRRVGGSVTYSVPLR